MAITLHRNSLYYNYINTWNKQFIGAYSGSVVAIVMNSFDFLYVFALFFHFALDCPILRFIFLPFYVSFHLVFLKFINVFLLLCWLQAVPKLSHHYNILRWPQSWFLQLQFRVNFRFEEEKGSESSLGGWWLNTSWLTFCFYLVIH